jgi:hypothetical protein
MRDKSQSYILSEDHKPINVELMVWAKWLEENPDKRRVALTRVGRKYVSTVFLGTNHNWFDDEDPILFETMIFQSRKGNTEFDEYQERYRTWDEAVKGHNQIVRKMKRKEKSQ